MELEQIRQLIQKAKTSAKDEECRQLVDHFEEFIELRHMRNKMPPGDVQFDQRLEEANKKFWASFNRTALGYGITMDTLRAYFENPKNFQKTLDELDANYRDSVKTAVQPPVKKLRKNKHNLKA